MGLVSRQSLPCAAENSKTWTPRPLREREKECPASLDTPTLQGQRLSSLKSCLKGSVFVCLRRVLGRLIVQRNLHNKDNTKCMCSAISEDRRHRVDCAENCRGLDTGKDFFNLTFVWFRFRVSAYWEGGNEDGLSTGMFWLRLRTAMHPPDSRPAEDLAVCSLLLVHTSARDYSPCRAASQFAPLYAP